MRSVSEQSSEYKLFQLIVKLVDQEFYGDVLIKFEAGHIMIIKKTEAIKPNEIIRLIIREENE